MPTMTGTTTNLDIHAHAAACNQIGCGHLYGGPSDVVRRAVLVHLAQTNGVDMDLDRETAAVAAIVGTLRSAQQYAPVYVRGTNANGNAAYVRSAGAVVLPEVEGFTVTAERRAVYALAWAGYSIAGKPEEDSEGNPIPGTGGIAARLGKSVSVVKSHMGNLRRGVGAHDAPSALLALVIAGELAAQ